MTRSLAHLIGTLFRWRKLLLARFVFTSLGRALALMAVIFFIREFLSSAVEERTAFTSAVAAWLGPAGVLWGSAGLLLLAYLCAALMLYDNQIVVQRIIKVIELGTMERVIKHLLTLSVPFADRQSHGDVIQTVLTDISMMRTVVQSAASVFLEGFVVVGLLTAAVWMSPSLSMWVVLVLPAVSLPLLIVSKQLRERSYTVRKTGYLLFDMVLEILKGMRVIKTFRGEEMQARMSVTKGSAYFDELVQIVRLQALGRVLMESLAGLSVVIVILVGGFQVIDGRLTWPSLLAFVMAVRVLHTPLNLVHNHFVQIQSRHASVWRVVEFLKTQPEVREDPDALPLDTAPREITCNHVGFSHGETEVLTDVCLTVSAGETIGIVGPSGAGKTTLLNLLIRLYDPTSGNILFDGSDLKK
ncbi:MAG: ABC transporter ATP-binding protein/permease, partial [Planctomycetota bacterium]|nr:ABC transporter ATP-binding protein/permease [Planctomycetota bacterium]